MILGFVILMMIETATRAMRIVSMMRQILDVELGLTKRAMSTQFTENEYQIGLPTDLR